MSARNLVLFMDGKLTLPMRLQLIERGAQAPPAGFEALEKDRSATRSFRLYWSQAFPDSDPLPFGPLAEADGRGTTALWDVLG